MSRNTRPQPRARAGRTSHSGAGTHFIQVAIPHRKPPVRPPVKCAANTISASSRLMFPVSRLAAIGNARMPTRIAVGSGRSVYAHLIDHRSSRIVEPRYTNHATSHGRSDHGVNSGSIH